MISNLKYLKDNIDTFDIVNFFKFLHCTTEDECREGFKTLVVDATYVNKKRYKDLINFAAQHEENNFKILNSDECKHYYEELKTQQVLDAYEETAWNREKAAAVKSIDVSKKILQSAKSSQPIPPQQQRSVQPPTQSFQKQQQKQNQTTENQDDCCKKRQKISNDSSNESLEPTESNDTSRNNTFGGKSDLSIDDNEEMASEIEDDQANDSDEEESTSADDETQISTIIEYHSHSPNEFHSCLSNETDDTYKTEISKSYAEMHKTKKYVLTFHEFNNETSASNGLEYDFNCNLVERLELSNISLVSGTNIQAEDLDAEEANKVKAWRRCTKQNNYFYPPQANSINECQLHTLLTRLNNAIIRENSHLNKNTSELEYIVEKVSVLLQYIFEPRSSLYFKWEKSSYSVSDDRCKDIRLDLVLFHNDQEIGCGEIKINCTDVKLLDEDKARIAETMKRQLHKRIISSRGLNEFKTFGFFFNGVQLELYTMTFNPESVDEHYQLYQEVDLKVPCFRDTYNNLEETLEYFKALKGIIENSLPQDPTNTPLLKQNYVTLFQPTFRFTKSQWAFQDAVEAVMNQFESTEEQALSLLRNALEKYGCSAAKRWLENWRTLNKGLNTVRNEEKNVTHPSPTPK